MKNFLISGLVDDKYRIKINLLAISPDHAIKGLSKNIQIQKIFTLFRTCLKNLNFKKDSRFLKMNQGNCLRTIKKKNI